MNMEAGVFSRIKIKSLQNLQRHMFPETQCFETRDLFLSYFVINISNDRRGTNHRQSIIIHVLNESYEAKTPVPVTCITAIYLIKMQSSCDTQST